MLHHNRVLFLFYFATTLVSVLLLSQPPLAQAGCGCDKPPPPLAAIRPYVAYSGTEVHVFSPLILTGNTYTVTFVPSAGGQPVSVQATAVFRRDLADSQYKPQLGVQVPPLPLGPTSIHVSRTGQNVDLLAFADSTFTVAPQPVAIPAQAGEYHLPGFRAAVSRAGVLYMSLDLSSVMLPLTFQAQAKGYPVRFTSDEVLFYNTQGFLMQLLDQTMPGLFSISTSTSSGDSDLLRYSRHEFSTYYLQHAERQPHALDPSDPNWHLDGTPHVDHNHLVVALQSTLNGVPPAPGMTPPFELVLQTASFFAQGLVGLSSIELDTDQGTDSYRLTDGLYGAQGDIKSNGAILLRKKTVVNGNATAAAITLRDNAKINGTKTITSAPAQFLPILVPQGLTDLQKFTVPGGQNRTLGPGSYRATEFTVSGSGRLFIDNSHGPVTMYVTGPVTVSGDGQITIADPNPEKFAIYVTTGTVTISGDGDFHGVVYAPRSALTLSGDGDLFGAFVGDTVKLTGGAAVHYDPTLRGE